MANNHSTTKAVVTSVKIGHIQIEGLMLPDGTFAIAVPQVARLFSINQSHASRDLKALLGTGITFAKVQSELHSKAVNILDLTEFELLIAKLDTTIPIHLPVPMLYTFI